MTHGIAPRILVCVVSAAFVAFLAIVCRQVRQQEITLGTISLKTADFSARELRIYNSANGTRFGHFIVFDSPNPTRYPVVFRLIDPDSVPVNCTTFTGICRGVHVETLVGCPTAPPFVLIDGVKPDILEQ